MDIKLSLQLKEVYRALQAGDFASAIRLSEVALEMDFEEAEVQAALKCAMYWNERKTRLEEIQVGEARADFLLREFTGFKNRFFLRLGVDFEEGFFSLKQWAFATCFDLYSGALDLSEDDDPRLLVKAGKSLKCLGEFEKAVGLLERAISINREDAGALSELADCYDQLSQPKMAKVLFREALYLDPQQLDLSWLNSAMLLKLVGELKDKKLDETELKEWLPVYGNIQGVLNVKREMRPLELGLLKQAIFSLKNELQETRINSKILVPRLLNKYLWLIDYYISIKEDRGRIDEILLNIKLVDPNIYHMLVN